jgi:hypothetical protein
MKNFLLLSLASLLAPAFCGKVHFRDCSSAQQSEINSYLRDVGSISQAAERFVGTTKFHAWFGNEISSFSDKKVKDRFHGLGLLPSSAPINDVTIDCAGQSNCCKAGLGG